MSNKFCKMCFDAGKVEVNHFLRDRQGVVTCPTLKGIKCRFCSGVGHTPKYCPVLKSKTEKEIRAQQFQKAKEEPCPADYDAMTKKGKDGFHLYGCSNNTEVCYSEAALTRLREMNYDVTGLKPCLRA
jgi:hypothetical protein